MAKEHVGNNPFAVLLGDDLIDSRDHLLEEMVRVREEKGGSVIALMEVPEESAPLRLRRRRPAEGDVVRITGLVEKPDASEAPSNLAIIGRYVLDPSVFEVLEHTKPGRGGEIQLTDALQELATSAWRRRPRRHLPRSPLRHRGPARLPQGRRQARLVHPELGEDFGAWLDEFAAERHQALAHR